jgi:hypothetical protein
MGALARPARPVIAAGTSPCVYPSTLGIRTTHVKLGKKNMADKIIAVLGSTGSQGGGLCRAILSDGRFGCRAITRDPNKDKAKALASSGAQVVQADMDDVSSLKEAFSGAHALYAVTNFWEHFSGDKEKAQAKNVA